MKWERILAGTALALSVSLPSYAAPLFPDVPQDHWATDAVSTLAAKGIIEGYPDGTYKGDRAASRWEVAMIVARLLAKMEQEHATFATKAELQELQRLVDSLRGELDALGVRVTALEDDYNKLDLRVSELERIRFYGRIHTIGVSNVVKGQGMDVGTVINPAVDWSSGRLLMGGTGASMMALLGMNIDVTDAIMAGVEFVNYTSVGSAAVDAYWGVSAPFNSNIWCAKNSLNPHLQPDSNLPFNRLTLDNFWIQHKPSDTRLVAGSYFNRYMEDFVFMGARNPNIHSPYWLPLNGINLSGTIAGVDSGFKYEAFYASQPNASLYDTQSYGGTLRYEFGDSQSFVALHGVGHKNRDINDGHEVGANAALIPLPVVPYVGAAAPAVNPGSWIGVNNTQQLFVGPQEQSTFGINASVMVNKANRISLDGEFATSSYDPDTTKRFFDTSVSGSMFKAGVTAAPIDGLNLQLHYQKVDPDFDPFISQYQFDTGIPVFLPFGGFYSNYYQMHDYVSLPNNREGFKFFGEYIFNEGATRVFGSFNNLKQVKATTPEQVSSVGNIEPMFTMLVDGGTEKGKTNSWGLGAGHNFTDKFRADLAYYKYDVTRSADNILNDMDLSENVYRLDLKYNFTDNLALRAAYQYLDYSGHSGNLVNDFNQTSPGLGFDWRISQDTQFSVDYRYIDFNQKAWDDGDYEVNQVMCEMKFDF